MKWSIVLILFLLAGCPRDPVSKVSSTEIEKTLTQTSPLTVQPRKFTKGEALYIRNCADCHGWEGRGNGPAAEFINTPLPVLQSSEFIAKKSESQFVDWVLNGPALKIKVANGAGLQTDSEVTALLAFIRKLPTIDWNKTDVGQENYDELCVNCHGLYGRGDGIFATQMPVQLPDLSASGYLNQYSDEKLIQIIGKGKNAMPGVEDILNKQEIEAVITFVRIFSPGYENYDRLCADCHGVDGSPIQFVILNEENDRVNFDDVDMPVFDDAYLKAHTDKQLIPKIQHMLDDIPSNMPHFAGYLKEEEVRQIFRYLGSLNAEPL